MPLSAGLRKASWAAMPKSRVLAVIVNYNGGHWVEAAVESLLAQTVPVDVIVMDNQSTDGSAQCLRERFAQIAVRDSGGNVGVATANNAVLDYEGYEYYLLFNPDAKAEPMAVERLADLLDRNPEVGGLGATLVEYNKSSIIQHFQPRFDPLCFPHDAWEGAAVETLPGEEIVDTGYLCTAAAIFRSQAYRDVGGMDPDFFLFTDDTDLSWRMRLRGWKLAATPKVLVRHVGGATAEYGGKNGRYETSEMRLYLRERNCWYMAIKCYAWWMLAPYAVVNTFSMLVESAVLWLLGKRGLAPINLHALRDVARNLPMLLRKRAAVQRGRVVPESEVLRTIYWGIGKLVKLRRDGIPVLKSKPAA